jgi:hypothetical protein
VLSGVGRKVRAAAATGVGLRRGVGLALTLWCRPYRLEVSSARPRFSLLGDPCPRQVTCCLWLFRETLVRESAVTLSRLSPNTRPPELACCQQVAAELNLCVVFAFWFALALALVLRWPLLCGADRTAWWRCPRPVRASPC